MCSILGLVDFDSKDQLKNEKIHKVNSYLTHRGPDDKGYYNDQYVSFAFNRLSILDLKNGNQPIIKNHIVSIFNGEIYNFKEIRDELKSFGFYFKSNSDSEIIASAFLKWGIKCIDKFNGMFSIAIYDKKNYKIYLIRDRVGIKPLYYSYFFNNSLIFCSEIKGIIKYPGFEKLINFTALSSYLSFRYPTGQDNSFFKNIKKVYPGSYLEIDLKKKSIKQKKYWVIPEIHTLKKNSENYYFGKLENLLTNSVKKQLISDVPLGVFLSGGLDSSILSAIASKHVSGKLKTYSVGFKEKKYDETSKAKLIAKYIGSEHTEVFIEKNEFLENLKTIIEIKDSPLSIPHEYPLYLLSKKMKEEIKVVLSGEGADEFFGGYSRVQKSPFDYLKAKTFGNLKNNKFLSKLFSIDQSFDFKNNEFLDFFFHKYNWFSFKETNDLLNNDIKNQIDFEKVKSPWKEILKKYESCNYYDQIMIMFQSNHLECLLDRLDSMTMANSIEARVPFLDHELIEFINTVPFEFKIRWKSKFHKYKALFSNNFVFSEIYDTNKYLLRKLGEKYLPNQIAQNKKLGFPLPMNEWMQDERIREILLDNKTLSRNIFNKNSLVKLLSMKNTTKDPYDFNGKKIWMLVNFELWIRSYID